MNLAASKPGVSKEATVASAVWLRLLGVFPLLFFTAHFIFYWTAPFYSTNRGIDNMLWMCNVGNLLLAVGLLTSVKWITRMATVWLIPGLPLWLFEVVRNGGWLLTSFLTHIGGLIVALIAISKIRAGKWAWAHALVWYIVMQLLSRAFTSPYWNVNVAHRIYGGYETVVSEYWQFWALTTAMVAAGLWVLGFILLKLFPPYTGE
ncbi:MAG TPA: hypothetical protein VLD57_06150, partial [Blastocatellia bacterium]|nr:hypothetical protein [Blastocatellia bacterium]